MKRKRLVALIVLALLCINPMQASAVGSTNPAESQVSQGDFSDISSVISKAVGKSSLIRASRSALDSAQKNYDDTLDASYEVTSKLLKKNKDYYTKVKDIMPLDAEYSLFTASNSLSSTENYVTFSLYEQYINLIKVLNSIEFNKTLIESEKNSLDMAESKYKLGAISKDQLDAESREYEKLELQKDANILNRDILFINLSMAIGLPIQNSYDNAVDLKTLEAKVDMKDIYNLKSIDEYLKEALESRQEILNAEKYLSVRDAQLVKVKAAYPNKSDKNQKDAVNKLADANTALISAKLQVESDVRDSYSAIQQKIRDINNSKTNMDIAKTDYEVTKAKEQNGLASSKDVEDAYNKYKTLEFNIKNSEYDLWLSELKFSYTCGLGLGQGGL